MPPHLPQEVINLYLGFLRTRLISVVARRVDALPRRARAATAASMAVLTVRELL